MPSAASAVASDVPFAVAGRARSRSASTSARRTENPSSTSTARLSGTANSARSRCSVPITSSPRSRACCCASTTTVRAFSVNRSKNMTLLPDRGGTCGDPARE